MASSGYELINQEDERVNEEVPSNNETNIGVYRFNTEDDEPEGISNSLMMSETIPKVQEVDFKDLP